MNKFNVSISATALLVVVAIASTVFFRSGAVFGIVALLTIFSALWTLAIAEEEGMCD